MIVDCARIEKKKHIPLLITIRIIEIQHQSK